MTRSVRYTIGDPQMAYIASDTIKLYPHIIMHECKTFEEVSRWGFTRRFHEMSSDQLHSMIYLP